MEQSAQPLMTINTTMTKEDYRKFLYFVTFKKNRLAIPSWGLLTALLSLLISFEYGYFVPARFVIGWALLFIIALGTIVFRVEKRYKQRLRTDRTGTFGGTNTLKFYEDKIAMESSGPKAAGELTYEQFYAVLESREFLIFYFTSSQASLIRKKDLADPEGFREFITGKFPGRYKRI